MFLKLFKSYFNIIWSGNPFGVLLVLLRCLLGGSWSLLAPLVGLLGPLGGLFGASWGLLAASVGLLVGLEAEKWPWLEREQDLLGFL